MWVANDTFHSRDVGKANLFIMNICEMLVLVATACISIVGNVIGPPQHEQCGADRPFRQPIGNKESNSQPTENEEIII